MEWLDHIAPCCADSRCVEQDTSCIASCDVIVTGSCDPCTNRFQ